MTFPLYTIDAFTVNDRPFTGNGAAVCIMNFDDDISDDVKQQIASEMNLSETAFVAKAWTKTLDTLPNTYTLRWFTLKTEVELCGHATLASAWALYDKYFKQSQQPIELNFVTKFKGILKAVVNPTDKSVTLDFPIQDCKPLDKTTNPWLDDYLKYTLGPKLDFNCVQDIEYPPEIQYLLIRLKDTTDINEVLPDFDKLSKVNTDLTEVVGVIVTQKGDDKIDFYSRFFAPKMGINEDPVTGSAHTVLTPYWKRQLNNRDEFVAKQCSQRGGYLVCKIVGQRVHIKGKAKIFMSGQITI